MFEIFVDSGANIPAEHVSKYGIHVICFMNIIDGRTISGFEAGLSPQEERNKGRDYYNAIRAGAIVKTSLINSEEFRMACTEGRKGSDLLLPQQQYKRHM